MYLNARRGLAIAVSAALLAASGACTKGSNSNNNTGNNAPADPGITATTLLIGTTQPLTGPAAAGYSKIAPATNAYFQYINAKQGGVNGRKITYKIVDDGYNPTTTNTAVRGLVQQDKIFAFLNGLGTPTQTAVLPFLKQQQVPDLFVASGSLSWNQPDKYPNTFAVNPDYASEGKIFGAYIKQNYAGQKVCHFGQGDDFGADGLQGLEKGLGAPVTAKQTYDVTQPNVGTQMTALKTAGCQVVFMDAIPGFVALAIGTSFQIGFHPQWLASGVGTDRTTLVGYLKAAGAPLLNGLIGDGYLPNPGDTNNSWIKLFQSINKDYNGNAVFDGNIIYGMAIGWLFVEALKKAGPNLTRAGLISAIEGGGFTGGPGVTPLLYSKTSHAGYGGVQLTKITGDTQAYFGTPYVTDSGDGAVQPYTQPPAEAPAYMGAP
jgi:branched-chain amino acid transport system substrate-binding protein